MEKLVRLMGTLLVLSLIFVACKKDDFSDGKKGEKDYSFKDDFSKNKSEKSKKECNAHYGEGQTANEVKKMVICHNGHLIDISINAVPHHFKQHSDDNLFSCGADGVIYADIVSTLNQIIVDNNIQGTNNQAMQSAFIIWYNSYYLTGNWPPDTDGGGVDPVDTTPVEPMMAVCHDGQLINVTYPVAFNYFENGDILFSCDPSLGVFYSDVEGPLLDIVYDYSLDANASDVMYKAFLLWYTDYYLAGNWPPDGGGAGGGGAGGGEGGTGTGSDTTVVVNN